MANKKKPFMTFESKEEFEKHFDEVYNEGKKEGFKDGTIWVLSYIEELMQDMFKPAAFKAAQEEISRRHIERWRKDEDAKTLKQELELRQLIKRTFEECAEKGF